MARVIGMSAKFDLLSAGELFPGLQHDLLALCFWHLPHASSNVRICAVGDIGLSGRVDPLVGRGGSGSVFAEIQPFFLKSNIVFGNLESPLVDAYVGKQMFAAATQGAVALKAAGFTLLHLANNHIHDFGAEGLQSTMDACRAAGLLTLGAGRTMGEAGSLVVTEAGRMRIGWLGCGRTLIKQSQDGPCYWELEEAQLMDAVAEARSKVDLLVVSLHIGLMYLDYPHPDHKALAGRLQKAGAGIVLMHHPHVLQGVEVDDNGQTICYSLGNFVLDWQEGNVVNHIMVREQNESAIFVFDVSQAGIVQAVAVPVHLDENLVVRWATGERGREILDRLARVSREIQNDYTRLFERQRAGRNAAPVFAVALHHMRKGNWRYLTEHISRFRLEHLRMFWLFFLDKLAGRDA